MTFVTIQVGPNNDIGYYASSSKLVTMQVGPNSDIDLLFKYVLL